MKSRMSIIIFSAILLVIFGKMVWIRRAMRGTGDFDTERKDLLMRRDFLVSKVLTDPEKLISGMPAVFGAQIQGEWALYTCSMLSASLVNMSILYPDIREEALPVVDSLVKMVLSPEIKAYDAIRWSEDPLENMAATDGHMSWYSHLAWMIEGWKRLGGDSRYDVLLDRLCAAMDRQMRSSPNMNVRTYPGEPVYVPDMLVAVVALANYSATHEGKYGSTVTSWVKEMKRYWLDKDTGLLLSVIPYEEDWTWSAPVKGSYSALNCYYLTFVDKDFAREQYGILKEKFLQRRPVAGIKEYHDRRCLLGVDVDAGPIVLNLSPSGTAFAVGAATFFGDSDTRLRFMRTGELAGFSVTRKGMRHYKLADIALVGEAIMLAMRTAVPWYD